MNRHTLRVFTLIGVSVIVAILLASALNNFTHIADSALADNSPTVRAQYTAPVQSRPNTTALKNYLPIIFLNSATAGGAWLLSGNAGTNATTDFLGTTDNVTLTFRVSNTIAYRIVPAYDPYAPGFAPNIIGGYSGNTVAPGVFGGTISGGGTSGFINSISASYGTVGGGQGNIANNTWATIGGGQSNTANGNRATIGGGYNNNASGDGAFVGGGYNNNVSGAGAFVGGGGYDGTNYSGNQVAGDASAIGGGWGNSIPVAGTYATIGGGSSNTASQQYTTIGGGYNNTASNIWATIGGGYFNTASHQYTTVGGGEYNTASGYVATVPGGYHNVASGDYSLAAGQHANTNNMTGAFVWADDSTFTVLTATVANQFLVRASGGITLYTNSAATSGASLYPGSGSWNILSNKNLKANFANVDARAILAQVNALPITTWNYTTQDASIRHIGPMAQDFASAFRVGENDTTISTVDAQGVGLAAIQGLSQENDDLKAQNASLKEQFATYQNETNARLAALEQSTGTANPLQVPRCRGCDKTGASALPISNDALFIGALVVIGFVIVGRRKRA